MLLTCLHSVYLQEQWTENPSKLILVFVWSELQCPLEAARSWPSSHVSMKWNNFLCVSRRQRNCFDTPNWIANFCLALGFSPSKDLLKCHSEWRHCPFIFPFFLLINILMSLFCCSAIEVSLESHKKRRKCSGDYFTLCFVNHTSNLTQIKLISAQMMFDIRLHYKQHMVTSS